MKKRRFLAIITLAIFSVIALGTGIVVARTADYSTNGRDANASRYFSSGAGPAMDHSAYAYYLDGEQVWCIEAGVPLSRGANYEEVDFIPNKAACYVMLSGRDYEVIQGAVWELVRIGGTNGSYVYEHMKDAELNELISEAMTNTDAAHQTPMHAWIEDVNGYYYDPGTNTYRCTFRASGMPNVSAGWVEPNGGENYTAVVDAATVSSDMDITFDIPAPPGSVRIYDGIRVFGSGSMQKLASPVVHDEPNTGASGGAHLEAVGYLKITKTDEHNNPVAGTTFRITGGPNGIDESVTTGANGWAEIPHTVRIGTYTVEETYVPANLVIDRTPRQVYVGSGTTNIGVVTQNNRYQRGKVTLTKYDAARRFFNGPKTLGDAKIINAKYEFYAAEDIYEGENYLYYRKDQLVKGDIYTAADGTTVTITDLPIGNYYYKEVEASEGFDVNPELVPAAVTYNGMDAGEASSNSYEHGESPQWYSLEINKRLSLSDHDAEANLSLHDTYHSFEGVQFKLTLNSDPTQVYYTHGSKVVGQRIGQGGKVIDIYEELSGDDGLCLMENIPYGVYTIEEYKWPIIVYKAEGDRPVKNWTIDFRDDSPDITPFRTARYYNDKRVIDISKKIYIEVNKKLIVATGEDTDAKIEGAYFTVYRDPQCEKVNNPDNVVCVIGPTNREGYAKLDGTVWAGTYYMKETTFPEGIDPDSKVLKMDGTFENVTYRDKIYVLECGPEKQEEEIVTYSYDIINVPKRNDIQIKKMIEGSSNTVRHEFENCEFTATLISSIGTDHEFSRKCTAPTNLAGWTVIENLPYGQYIVRESYCPPISLPCSDFKIFIQLDRKEKTNPTWYEPTEGIFTDMTQVINTPTGAIVDPIKKMILKIRKVDAYRNPEDPADYTSGHCELKGAVYSIYGLDPDTNQYTTFVKDMVVDKQDDEGYWYAESEELQAGSYLVKEKALKNGNISYSKGYLVDDKSHYYYSDPTEQDKEVITLTDVSKETPYVNDIEIFKQLEETETSPREWLAGAEFTATLKGTENTSYEYKKSATTDEYGHCIIEDLPFGEYIVKETVVPQGAVACIDFTINITEDKSQRGAYTPKDSKEAQEGSLLINPVDDAILDDIKTMDIKIRKVDIMWEPGAHPELKSAMDAELQGAIYSIYRWEESQTDYVTYIGDMVVEQKDEEGFWYAEYTGLRLGKYKVVEKAKNGEKEAYSRGYRVDPEPHYFEMQDGDDVLLHTHATVDNGLVKYSKETPIHNDIEIIKKIQETSNTPRAQLAGAEFTATLISSLGSDGEVTPETKQYKSTLTDDTGYCIITDLPYGIYRVEETIVPETTLKCSDFEVFIEKDKEFHRPYRPEAASFKGVHQFIDEVDGAIVDISKKMVIKVRKVDSERGDKAPEYTQGDAILKGAIYEVYRLNKYTGEYSIKCEDIEVKEKDTEGYWYAETKELIAGDYKIVEKAREGEYSYAEGYLIDHNEYFFSQDPAEQEDEISYHVDTSIETVVKNKLRIKKKIGETTNTPLKGLAGARFTATLVSSKGSGNEIKFVSTITDDTGFCIIEDLPYGTYEVEETVVPASTFKCSNFTITISEDKGARAEGYFPTDGSFDDTNQRIEDGAIVDTPKIMDIKLRKVDFERKDTDAPDYTQGDADLQNAIYEVYMEDPETHEYKKCEQELVINRQDEEGYWYGEVTGLKTGTYKVVEKAKENGIYSYATGYKIDNEPHYFRQNPEEQHVERVKLVNTSKEQVIRNDIKIKKKLGATANTELVDLSGCQFTATLVSTKGTANEFKVSSEDLTDASGCCVIKNLPYGEYEVEETIVADEALKCSNFTVFVADDMAIKNEGYGPKDGIFALASQEMVDGAIVDTPKVMNLKMRKVDANRTTEEPGYTQGDATLKGAIYKIYEYNKDTKEYEDKNRTITIDKQDAEGYWYGQYDELKTGKYMVKEDVARTDPKTGAKYSHATGYLVDENEYIFEVDPATQTERVITVTNTSAEEVIRGYAEVIKKLDEEHKTEESAAEGAILRLTLDSDPSIYYDVVIDNTGYGMFVDVNDEKHMTSVKTNYGYPYYPYTIPYGDYTITEVRASDKGLHTSYYIYPEKLDIKLDHEVEKRIELDDGVPVKLEVEKIDAETNQRVPVAGAAFKIWDKKNNCFVRQRLAGNGEYREVFYTNNEGKLQLPDPVEAGWYIVYETKSPDGYYLEDKYRLPENPADYGNENVSGDLLAITKRATGLDEDATPAQANARYTAKVPDRPLMGQIKIYKTGKVFTGIKSETVDVEGILTEVKVPQFEDRGLQDVEFTIYAAEDIYTGEGTKRYSEGQVVDVVTTNIDGHAVSKELYLGEYRIEETRTPLGYVKEDNISNVVLTNNNMEERVELTKKAIDNKRQKAEIKFTKTFEEVKYLADAEEQKVAVFGVFANEDIKNYYYIPTLHKDDLVDVIFATEGEVVSTVDLPDGSYYYKEIYSSYPYRLADEEIPFEISHRNTTDPAITIFGEDITNEYVYGDLYLAKFSSTEFIKEKGITLVGGKQIDVSDELKNYVDRINSLLHDKTIEEVQDIVKSDGVTMLNGARYLVYIDPECTKPLRHKLDNGGIENVEIVTDGNGFYKLEGIPFGNYYFKEVEAPTYESKGSIYHYEISEDIVNIQVSPVTSDNIIIRALCDEAVTVHINKTDIFTGKRVPDCLFTITDESGTELVKFITNEEGDCQIPTDIFENGKYYYFTELEAKNPFYYTEDGRLYELNTEPHRFQAHVTEDGEWAFTYIDENGVVIPYEKPVVYNYRPTSIVTLTKLDIMDSTPVPNCKFELRSKETDWVVEGITDENGVYVFMNVPYGEYTYTELEAPEEYLIDTTPHDITIDTEDTKIVVYDLRAPEEEKDIPTSDIAVASLVVVSAISIFGIFFIIRKRKISEE